jgi:hypothetical protein
MGEENLRNEKREVKYWKKKIQICEMEGERKGEKRRGKTLHIKNFWMSTKK